MKTIGIRCIRACILALCLAIPGVASADMDGSRCDLQGTWFGVNTPDDLTLTGWMATVTGKSHLYGTNNLEFPTFDPRLMVPHPSEPGEFVPLYPDAAQMSSLRGTWKRTGFNTFFYSMTGIAVAADGVTPIWIGKLSGSITLSADCNTETITATIETYHPSVSPFGGPTEWVLPFPTHYGHRADAD